MLGLVDADGHYNFGYFEEAPTRALVRLSGATEEARRRVVQWSTLLSSTSATAAAKLITKAVRLSMETIYKKKTGRKLPLEHQASDQLLGKAFKKVSDGYASFFGLREMVPFLVDDDTRLFSQTKSASRTTVRSLSKTSRKSRSRPRASIGRRRWRPTQ